MQSQQLLLLLLLVFTNLIKGEDASRVKII